MGSEMCIRDRSMILTFLVWSKECYDKGSKRDSYIFLGVAIFIAAITAFNIISNFSSKENNAEIQNGETVQMHSQEESTLLSTL